MITPSFGLTATERVLPRMALDFTTAVLDPRVTFTRAGNTATVINSSGLVAPINADLPRFDFNPTTLACNGLLIEESSVNLLTYSEDFSNIIWAVNTSMGVAASAITDPAGGTNAFTLTANASPSTFGRVLVGTIGVPYTYSLWIRRKTGTGVIRIIVGDNVSQIVTSQVSSAWNRISVTSTPTTTTVRAYVAINTSGDEIEIYGAQLEQKAFGTSYIPTVASQVTRNADVATMTGTNFSDWYNASEGAFAIWCSVPASTASFAALSITNGTNSERILVNVLSNRTGTSFRVVDNNIDQTNILKNVAWTAGQQLKIVGAYKLDSFATTFNGTSVVTGTPGTIPTVSQLGTFAANFHIQKILYYPQRIIDAEVQAFSK